MINRRRILDDLKICRKSMVSSNPEQAEAGRVIAFDSISYGVRENIFTYNQAQRLYHLAENWLPLQLTTS